MEVVRFAGRLFAQEVAHSVEENVPAIAAKALSAAVLAGHAHVLVVDAGSAVGVVGVLAFDAEIVDI